MKQRRAVGAAQRQMHMGGAACVLRRGFGEEGDAAPARVGDLLDAVLHDRVAVGHQQRPGVADVDLLLPRVRLALGAFNRDVGAVEAGAHRAHHVLLARGELDGVVGVEPRDRRQPAIAARARLLIGLAEQVELKLGRGHRLRAQRRQPRDLALEDGARRVGDLGLAVVVERVAQTQRRARQPRDAAQRREVRAHRVVAIARRPARRRVSRHRAHLQIGGQQIVAAMGLGPGAVEEELGLEALAHQAALHVHLRRDHGVDVAGRDGFLQVFKRQGARHFRSSLTGQQKKGRRRDAPGPARRGQPQV